MVDPIRSRAARISDKAIGRTGGGCCMTLFENEWRYNKVCCCSRYISFSFRGLAERLIEERKYATSKRAPCRRRAGTCLTTRPDPDISTNPAVLWIEEKCVLEINISRAGNRLPAPGISRVISPRNKPIPAGDQGRASVHRGYAVERGDWRCTHIL